MKFLCAHIKVHYSKVSKIISNQLTCIKESTVKSITLLLVAFWRQKYQQSLMAIYYVLWAYSSAVL